MTVYAQTSTIPAGCGLGLFNEFMLEKTRNYYYIEELATAHNSGGTGWAMATFVAGDAVCDEAYKVLKERMVIKFESPRLHNKNSGNEFYFVIYDGSENEAYGFDGEDDDDGDDNDFSASPQAN